jgi:hypothetical protein
MLLGPAISSADRGSDVRGLRFLGDAKSTDREILGGAIIIALGLAFVLVLGAVVRWLGGEAR